MTSTAAEAVRDGWLDPHAAGKYIGIHPEQIRRLCRDGKIHYRRMGSGPCAPYRFKASWLDAYVEGRSAAEVAAEEKRSQRASGRTQPRRKPTPIAERAAS